MVGQRDRGEGVRRRTPPLGGAGVDLVIYLYCFNVSILYLPGLCFLHHLFLVPWKTAKTNVFPSIRQKGGQSADHKIRVFRV